MHKNSNKHLLKDLGYPHRVTSIKLSPQRRIHAIPIQSSNISKTLSPDELILRRILEELCQKKTPPQQVIKESLKHGLFPQQNYKFPSLSLPLRLLQINGRNPLIPGRVIAIPNGVITISYYEA